MDNIVYRAGIPCKLIKDGYNVSVWDSKSHRTSYPHITDKDGSPVDLSVLRGPVGGWVGTGQREIRVTRRVVAVQVDPDQEFAEPRPTHTGKNLTSRWNNFELLPGFCMHQLHGELFVDIDIQDLERKAERSVKKSQQRAKRQCRYKVKHGGFRHMLTGTYRENVTDFDRMRRDHHAWMRKVRAVLRKFRAVYAFEPQKRGAWHFHQACDALPRFLRHKGVLKPSYEVVTLLWHEVVGDVLLDFHGPLREGESWPVVMVSGGTINVDGYTKKNRRKMHADARQTSLAKMASYISKYLTKDIAHGLRGRQMWGSTEDLTPPKPIRYQFAECSMVDLIAAVFELPPGHRVARHWMNPFADCWVLDTEPIPL